MSAKSGSLCITAYNWDHESCPLYGVAGCPLFRGCLSIEVNGRTVWTFRIVRYIMGVRFSGVSHCTIILSMVIYILTLEVHQIFMYIPLKCMRAPPLIEVQHYRTLNTMMYAIVWFLHKISFFYSLGCTINLVVII